MKTYHSVKELFALAEENHCSPGVIACRLESEESGKDFDEVWEKMKKTIPVFRQSIQRGLADTKNLPADLWAVMPMPFSCGKAVFESCMPPCLCLCYSNSGSKC